LVFRATLCACTCHLQFSLNEISQREVCLCSGKYYSSGLSFAAPDAGVILEKWFGGFAEGTDVPVVAKSGGNGVVYCLKTFVCKSLFENCGFRAGRMNFTN